MAVGDSILVKTDSILNDIFSGWSFSTTIIATLLFFFLAYPWLTWRDPDTHPFLLARQANASPVRQPGESSVYRAAEVPYGYPLRSGLNVKDPGAPKWSSGRNGDLRDIWIQATRGPLKDDGSSAGRKGKLLTVLGRAQTLERSLESVTLEINVIGKHIQDAGCKRVAICLSNSVELLASIFAASFYGAHPILIPYGGPADTLIEHLKKVQPDVLIAEAGALEVHRVFSGCQNLKQVMLVTKPGNEHMDFAEDAEMAGSKLKVSTWHDLVEENKSLALSEVPPVDRQAPSPSLSLIESSDDTTSVVEYTSENLVSAIAALINTLPRNQRITPLDTILPICPLTTSYPLLLTLASLFSHATIALTSVAGSSVDFLLATSSTPNPTILISTTATISSFHTHLTGAQSGLLPSLFRYWQTRSLSAGYMPKTPSFTPKDSLSKLRLLFIYHSMQDLSSPRLSPTALTDLRIALGTRICYALAAPHVAGAVCQSNMFDYRESSEGQENKGESHFGPPVSSVEVVLKGEEKEKGVGAPEPEGKIVVRGPAVAAEKGEVELEGVLGRVKGDGTVVLV